MDRLFNLDPQLLHDTILLAINVFVLFIILSYVLFNPVRKILNDRKKSIENDLNNAKKTKEEAELLKSDYEKKLKEADKEVDEILSEARKRGQQNEKAIITEAKNEATEIVKHAEKEAMLEKKKVGEEVKNEIIDVATIIAKKVSGKNIDVDTNDALIDDLLNEMGDKTWQD